MRWLSAAAAVALAVASATAQTTTPVRDTEQPPTTGSGSVSGRVITDDRDPTPVRRAVVSLVGDGLRPSRGAITDDEGRFRIGNLPAGRFTLTVSRASFITSIYGARRAGRAGTPVVVRESETVNDLVVRLWRGAAIGGVIRDETGTPVEGITVTAVPATPSGGQTTLTLSNNGAVTNDLGEFRVFGLAPGTYVISAKPQAEGQAPIVAMADAEVDAALESLSRRTPGVAQPAAASGPPPSSARPFDYAAVYYPGTASRAQATPITLAAGAEQVGLDFALQRVATVAVAGTVTRANGQPAAGAAVQLIEVVPRGPFAPASPRMLSAVTGPDGRFRITQVGPGSYQIVTRAGSADQPLPAGPLMVTPGSIGASALWAAAEVSVADSDVTGVALAVEPGRTLSGRVRFDGSRPAPDLNPVRVSLVPLAVLALPPGSPIFTLQPVVSATPGSDGRFELSGIGPGTYRLVIGGPGLDGWLLRSAMRGGQDLLDGDIDVDRATNLDGVLATFSDRRTTLSGRLQTPAGLPVTDVFVIAFSVDRRFWGPGSRRVQAVRPANDGSFTIAGLPAGPYRLAAVTDVDKDEWQDPGFLTLAEPASIPVSLVEGETRTQDLRVGGP